MDEKKLPKVGDTVTYVGTLYDARLTGLTGKVVSEDDSTPECFWVLWPVEVRGSKRVLTHQSYIQVVSIPEHLIEKSAVWEAMVAATMGLTYDQVQKVSDALEDIGITGPKTEVTVTLKAIVDEDTSVAWVKQFAEQRGYDVTEFSVSKETKR